MGKPTPQDTVNAASEKLKHSDTKLQVAATLRLFAGYILPPSARLATTALSLLTGFEGGKRYHDYRDYKDTLKEAQQKNPRVKPTYPGFFHWPTPEKMKSAVEDLELDVHEAYKIAEEGFEQVKSKFD